MRHRCTVLWFLVLVGVFCSAREAAAQEPADPVDLDKSAVVVIDAGGADLFVESLVRSAVEASLINSGYTIASGAAVGGDTPAKLLACSGDLACAASAMAGIHARYAMFLSLRTDEPGETAHFKIIARSFEVRTGAAVARVMRRCESCIEDDALATFSEEVARLLVQQKQEAKEPTPVESVEAPVETTPIETLPIGEPIVDVHTQRSFDWKSVGKYASLGVGATAIATGTVLVLIDGPVIENGVRQPQANDTATLGFVSIGTGVALVGLSAWLWSQGRDEPDDAIVVQASGSAGSISYAGAF